MVCILVVDDSPTEMYQFKTMLERRGYAVLEAHNGAEGVAKAREEQPDLVLMDVVMPGINGFQATRQIVKGVGTGHIPVIIVTTKDQETDRVWGERQGARDYLVKPVDEHVLIASIEGILRVSAEG